MSVRINRLSASTVLMRLRTADNQAGGAGLHHRQRRRCTSAPTWPACRLASRLRLTTGTWTRLELCATAGPSGTLTLTVDGAPAASYTGNMGTAGFGMVEIGEAVEQHLVRQLRRRGGRRPDVGPKPDDPSRWARWPMAATDHDT